MLEVEERSLLIKPRDKNSRRQRQVWQAITYVIL